MRRTSLAACALLLDTHAALATSAQGELLAAFDVMLRDRVGKGGAAGGAGQDGSGRKEDRGGKVKENRTGVAGEVQATLQFRVLLLQCIRRFVALLAAAATSSTSSEVTVDAAPLSEPASFSPYAAALRAAVADGPSTTAARAAPELPSVVPLTPTRPTPLKYMRKSVGSASGKPTKKATITSLDDTDMLASLELPTAVSAAPSTASASAFTAAVSLAAFVQLSVPLLALFWLEALGGGEVAAQHSNLTTDSYQCAEACLSILHTYTTVPSVDAAGLLQPFWPLLLAHVFQRFPLVSTSSGATAADIDLLSSINVHICHLIASYIPPAAAPTQPADDVAAEAGEGSARKERLRVQSAEAAAELSECTSEMLDFIGQSLFQSSASAAQAPLVGGGRRKKRRKGETASTALLSPSHISELLPIVEQLVGRLPAAQQQWLLDAFTAYYSALHELSPAKLQCLSLIATLLQPPTAALCLSLNVGHAWLRSLPPLLVASPPCRPAVIRLLQFVLRCWHSPQQLDLSPLLDHCTAFYCEHLLSVPAELQLAALSLLPHASTLPPPLLSAFAALFNAADVDGGVRCMLLETVAVHRHRVGVGAYLSFLLSCLSSSSVGEKSDAAQWGGCHPYVELVLVRLRELSADEVLLRLLPASSPRRTPAELLVLFLAPTLHTLLQPAAEMQSTDDTLHLSPHTLLTLVRCLCEQVRQSTRSAATAQLLPPSLVPPLVALLSASLLSPSASAHSSSSSVSTAVSLLGSAPFLLPAVLARLLADVRVESGGRLCDVLLWCLQQRSRLRRWLLSADCADGMAQAVRWLQQAAGVDAVKLQAIELLL